MKKHFFNLLIISFVTTSAAFAQKGNNQLQASVQLALPTGQLAQLAKLGFGASAKGLFGFGESQQQITIEAGYDRFGVKEKFLPKGVEAEYRTIPLYTGYRYRFSGFYVEPQAGVAINTIYASNTFALKGETKAYFAWATGVGYSYKQFDFAVRYQSSDVKDESSDINFVALRIGYRLPFYNKNNQWK